MGVTCVSNCLSIYNGSEPYIFVSYSHKDTQRVMPLIHGLQRRGFRVWYDNGIGGGSKFAMIIAEHLGKCHCMIAFLTPNYDASEYCRMEVTFSLDRKKAALPVYLEDFTPSDGLYFLLCTGHALYLSNYGGVDDFLDKLETAPLLQPCRYPAETFTPPTQPVAKPVQPMQPPVQPTQPPVQPMQPPVQPVQPQQPVQPTGNPVQPSGVNPFTGGRAYASPSRSGSGGGANRFPRGSFDASGQQPAGGANRFPHGSFNAAGQTPASGAPRLPVNGTQQPIIGVQPQQPSNPGGQPQTSGANRFPHGSFNAGGQAQGSGVNQFPHGSFNAGTQQPGQSGSKLLEGLFGDLFGSGNKKK